MFEDFVNTCSHLVQDRSAIWTSGRMPPKGGVRKRLASWINEVDEAVSEPHEAPSGGVRQRLSAKAEAKAAAAASSSSSSGVNTNHELPKGGVRKRL